MKKSSSILNLIFAIVNLMIINIVLKPLSTLIPASFRSYTFVNIFGAEKEFIT